MGAVQYPATMRSRHTTPAKMRSASTCEPTQIRKDSDCAAAPRAQEGKT